MSQRLRAMAAGMSAQEANMVCTGSTSTGAVATGTSSQSAALVIQPNTNLIFATVALNSGAALPFAGSSGPIYIFNGGSNPLLLYPVNGASETINGSSANASFSLTNAKGAMCFPLTTGWAVILSA